MLIELFFTVTAEVLRANIEIGVYEGSWSVSAKFPRSRRRPPRTMLSQIDRPVNALQLCH